VGHDIDVIYVEGAPEHHFGTQMYAAELALIAQLRIVPTADDTVRWVKDPDTWHAD